MERKWLGFPLGVWAYGLLLSLLTVTPYVVGFASAPPGGGYSGALVEPFGVSVDVNSHLAKLWQGRQGQLAYCLPFTAERHPCLLGVQGFYVLLGALLPLDVRLSYHLARFALSLGVVLGLWRLIVRLLAAGRGRWWALLAATLLMGYGWLLPLVAPHITQGLASIEFWLSDAYAFLGMLIMPHFAAAILLHIGLILALDDWQHRRGGSSRLALILAALAIVQPYGAALFGPVLALGGVILVGWRRALTLVPLLALYGALTLAQLVALSSDPTWQAFSAQNITLSPPPLYLLLGYAPFLLALLMGLRVVWPALRTERLWWVLALWAGLAFVLAYAPLQTQRRYLLGVQTPLALLAASAWAAYSLDRRRIANLLGLVGLGLGLTAPLLLMVGNVSQLSRADSARVFYDAEQAQAYDWVRNSTLPSAVFWTTFDWDGLGSGGLLAALTGRRVSLGHWIETRDFDRKIAQVRRFYDPQTGEAERLAMLERIDYVWYDDWARALGSWWPGASDRLRLVYRGQTIQIYEVLP
ncbi:MAG: hypothetical protein NZ750_08495 [Anaerolineae bacterium]|nr:hypothetical protein [Anaerolineae bacterium]MDW8172408.1 hypothetical protein [Anaerolineae bacterium]